jgi:hypothetical protein
MSTSLHIALLTFAPALVRIDHLALVLTLHLISGLIIQLVQELLTPIRERYDMMVGYFEEESEHFNPCFVHT